MDLIQDVTLVLKPPSLRTIFLSTYTVSSTFPFIKHQTDSNFSAMKEDSHFELDLVEGVTSE